MEEVSLELIKDILLAENIKPSLHRISILKYLIEKKNHPSVDVIYKNLVQFIPTLSKTTVYNVLKLFTKKQIIVALNIDEAEIKYDYVLKPHSHFLCIKCKSIFDINSEFIDFKNNEIDGHEVLEAQVNLKGYCLKCRN